MKNVIVKLAKSYSNGLMEQVYFIYLMKESITELTAQK